MPASKRRRAAINAARPAAPSPEAPAEPVVEEPAATEEAQPAPRRARPATTTNPDDEPQWSRLGLLVLLALVFVVQLIIGAITHLIGHRQRLLAVDLLFFQAPFLLPGCVLMMPAAKYLTHQPRTLRLLESLSLGAVFALVSLALTSAFVHPTVAGNLTLDQTIDRLTSNDAAALALADVLSMVATVQVYPGLNRFLGAPGRRARKRMLARSQAARAPVKPRRTASKPAAATRPPKEKRR